MGFQPMARDSFESLVPVVLEAYFHSGLDPFKVNAANLKQMMDTR